MRTAAVLLLAAALGGCDHLYGAADVRLSDAQAIQIARREAAHRHVSLKGMEPSVGRFETGTSVWFDTPERRRATCLDGGNPLFFIPTGKRRVSHVASDDA